MDFDARMTAMRKIHVESRRARQDALRTEGSIQRPTRLGLRNLIGDRPEVLGQAGNQSFIRGGLVSQSETKREFKHTGVALNLMNLGHDSVWPAARAAGVPDENYSGAR